MGSSSSQPSTESSIQSPSIDNNAPTASVSSPFRVPVDERLIEPLSDRMEGLQMNTDAKPLPNIMPPGNPFPVASDDVMPSGNPFPVASDDVVSSERIFAGPFYDIVLSGNPFAVPSNGRGQSVEDGSLKCRLIERTRDTSTGAKSYNRLKIQIGTNPKQFRRKSSSRISTDAGPSSRNGSSRISTDAGPSSRRGSPRLSTEVGPSSKGSCQLYTEAIRSYYKRLQQLNVDVSTLSEEMGSMHLSEETRLQSSVGLPGIRRLPVPPNGGYVLKGTKGPKNIEWLRKKVMAQGELSERERYRLLKCKEAVEIHLVKMMTLLKKMMKLAKLKLTESRDPFHNKIRIVRIVIQTALNALDFYTLSLNPSLLKDLRSA